MAYKRKADCTPEEWEEHLRKQREYFKTHPRKNKTKDTCSKEEWNEFLKKKRETRKHKSDYTKEEWDLFLQKRREYRAKHPRRKKTKNDYTVEEWKEILEKQHKKRIEKMGFKNEEEWSEYKQQQRHKKRKILTEDEIEKRKIKKRESDKKYREAHKEHIRQIQKLYGEKHRQEKIEYLHRYYNENKDVLLRKQKIYNEKNRKKRLVRDRKYYQTHKEQFKKYDNETKIPYDLYANRLTIDEEPIKDEDGFMLVRDFHTKEYFYPRRIDVCNRIRALNGVLGGEHHLYASNESKQACPIYNARDRRHKKRTRNAKIDPFWRKQVISRADGHCERCGKESEKLIAHHLAPRATCAFDGDIDNGMALCPECHKEVHDMDGCRFNELAAEKRKAS